MGEGEEQKDALMTGFGSGKRKKTREEGVPAAADDEPEASKVFNPSVGTGKIEGGTTPAPSLARKKWENDSQKSPNSSPAQWWYQGWHF